MREGGEVGAGHDREGGHGGRSELGRAGEGGGNYLPPILAHFVFLATARYPVGHAHCWSTHTAPPSQ